MTDVDQELRGRFNSLAFQWHMATSHSSSVRAMLKHPLCQEILDLGEAVIPLVQERINVGSGYQWQLMLDKLNRKE